MTNANNTAKKIFSRSSNTYFYSSLFFPKKIREDITTLYAFVRTADNFVDSIPQDLLGFQNLKKQLYAALSGKSTNNLIIDNFVLLAKTHKFQLNWIDAFMGVMEQDTVIKKYHSFADLQKYIYGSAEIIGIMIAKILNLPKASYPFAMAQGRAMQFINFIRDIDEDLTLGRVYIPQKDIEKFGLKSLKPTTPNEIVNFQRLIRYEIDIYRRMQEEASRGYDLIPRKYRVAIKTAADMYKWTAENIYKNLMIVFQHKIKPNKMRVVLNALLNLLKAYSSFDIDRRRMVLT